MQEGTQIWEQAKCELQLIVVPEAFDTWFQHARALAFDGTTITIGVSSVFTKAFLEKRLSRLIRRVLDDLGYEHVQPIYAVEAAPTASASTDERANALSSLPSARPSGIPSGVDQQSRLNPQYRSDTFIVGGCNRDAFQACVNAAEHPVPRDNPLCICGSVGLGKTHLLHATGHLAAQLNPAVSVLSTTAEQLGAAMVWAVQRRRANALRSTLLQVDLLLIDDVHFISGYQGTTEDFVLTLAARYEAHKQIVIAGDSNWPTLARLDARLRSCFARYQVVALQPPDLETRMAILQMKAEQQALKVPHQVLSMIALRCESTIRELEAALTTIGARSTMDDVPITTQLAARVLAAMRG